jgi:hypothetical protein
VTWQQWVTFAITVVGSAVAAAAAVARLLRNYEKRLDTMAAELYGPTGTNGQKKTVSELVHIVRGAPGQLDLEARSRHYAANQVMVVRGDLGLEIQEIDKRLRAVERAVDRHQGAEEIVEGLAKRFGKGPVVP